MTMPNVQAFGARADGAIRNLQSKTPMETDSWNDLLGPVHAKQFTVAGAPLDVVTDIQAAMVQALEGGMSLSDFRKVFDDTVQRNGWTYKGKRGWRTALIYNTNMHSAYMAGRWQQIQDNADRRPYLEYRAVNDSKTRPQHRAWDGTILPVNDAFWQTHYPPNGWNCRCTVRSYSQRELDRANKPVSKSPTIARRDVISRDGEITDNVPVGIDPGWDHNVGESWIAPEVALGKKLATVPKVLQPTAIRQSITNDYRQALSERWSSWYQKVRTDGKPRGATQIVGYLPDGVTMGLTKHVPDLDLQSITIGVFDRRTIHLEGAHKATGNAAQVWPADWIARLPLLIGDYRAVLWDSIHESIVVIPKGALNGKIPRVALKPNQKSREGPVISVTSLGTGQLENFKQPEFTVIAGSLD